MKATAESAAIAIDGSRESGSGSLVRLAVALAALRGRPLHMRNARARRPKPGLRPQHLAAVRACAELCEAETQGLAVGASEFRFTPGRRIRGGEFDWHIGTSGSTTMLAYQVLPVACFARAPLTARITGGVFQDFAPSPHHMQHVLAPVLARMGIHFSVCVLRPGYVPRGEGVIELRVKPARSPLTAFSLSDPGTPGAVSGIALASHLAERRVAERMATECEHRLADAGLECRIERVQDERAAHAGASLAAWTETSTGCRLGADRAGARRRSSEAIGRAVATHLLEDLASGATTDRHLADQLVLFAALAAGRSCWLAPSPSVHLRSSCWLAERFGAMVTRHGRRVEIEGLGLER